MPKPWDRGTRPLPAHLRFEALATSMSYDFSSRQRGNTIDRERMMGQLSAIAAT